MCFQALTLFFVIEKEFIVTNVNAEPIIPGASEETLKLNFMLCPVIAAFYGDVIFALPSLVFKF